MSGGFFDYLQHHIREIAGSVERLIRSNGDVTPDGHGGLKGYGFSPETVAEFQKGYELLRLAEIYVERMVTSP